MRKQVELLLLTACIALAASHKYSHTTNLHNDLADDNNNSNDEPPADQNETPGAEPQQFACDSPFVPVSPFAIPHVPGKLGNYTTVAAWLLLTSH